MKQSFFFLILLCLAMSLPAGQTRQKTEMILDIPVILQEGAIDGRAIDMLCGVTCAEMVLKYYGITTIRNIDIADEFCSGRNRNYNIMMHYSDREKVFYSTNCEQSLKTGINFPGTNTHVLQLYFQDLGFRAIRRRSLYDNRTGMVPDKRFNEFMGHVRKGAPVIIHVQEHYMLVVGFNDSKGVLVLNDPSDPARITVSYARFQNRNNTWRPRRPSNKGWDGRYIAVYK